MSPDIFLELLTEPGGGVGESACEGERVSRCSQEGVQGAFVDEMTDGTIRRLEMVDEFRALIAQDVAFRVDHQRIGEGREIGVER